MHFSTLIPVKTYRKTLLAVEKIVCIFSLSLPPKKPPQKLTKRPMSVNKAPKAGSLQNSQQVIICG